jgi:hypothetical protein
MVRPATRTLTAVFHNMWVTWACSLPGALTAIWLIGFVADRRSAYAHADMLHNARCSACGEYCRVLDPETRCIVCVIKGRLPEDALGAERA